LPTVLVVSRYFPPLGSAGASIRLIKFMKYARLEGWRFIVFTEDLNKPVIVQEKASGFLLDEVPPDTEIIRVPNPLFGKRGVHPIAKFIFKDSSLPWGMNVIWNCLKQIRKGNVNLIFANSPPFTNPFVGSILKLYYRLPFVLDIRDDWVGTPTFSAKDKFRQTIEKFFEEIIIRSAQFVVLVTEASFILYKERYKKIKTDYKFNLISNGCDLEEYRVIMNRKKNNNSKQFKMLGVGSGYRKEHRDLTPLLQGLGIFFEKHPDALKSFTIEFLGNEPSEEYKDIIEVMGIADLVKYFAPVGRKEFVERLWSADLLFDVLIRGIPTRVSGTLYEYWATGKAPILLISEEGAASKILKENQLGRHALFDEVDVIAEYIEEVYTAYSSGSPVWITREGVEKYSRKYLTEKMVGLWKQAVEGC
jgi:hypothetical protein